MDEQSNLQGENRFNIEETLKSWGVHIREDGSYYTVEEFTVKQESERNKESTLCAVLQEWVTASDIEYYYETEAEGLIVKDAIFDMFDAFKQYWLNNGFDESSLVIEVVDLGKRLIYEARLNLNRTAYAQGTRNGVHLSDMEERFLRSAVVLKIFENYILENLDAAAINQNPNIGNELLRKFKGIKSDLLQEAEEVGRKSLATYYDF